MATVNPFYLLVDDDGDDPSLMIASLQQKVVGKKPVPAAATAKLPSKPAPPAQAVKDARSNTAPTPGGYPGGYAVGRGGSGRGRGGRGSGPGRDREIGNGNLIGFSGGYGGAGGGGEDGQMAKPVEREHGYYDGIRQPYRGGPRGGYGNEEGGDFGRPRRVFDRHSGTGRSNELKREGSGRGNWGSPNDDAIAQETEEVAKNEDKMSATKNQVDQEDMSLSEANKGGKDVVENENEEKEAEDKEMTLGEYEKLMIEKRKALLSMKVEERKVDFDKDFESMKQLSLKKGNDDIFIKLGGGDKDSRRKDNADRDDRVKKSVSINEFLKPAEGERYYGGGRGRGRGRGRGDRGHFRDALGGDVGGTAIVDVAAPAINDPGHFPTLGGK